jgi:hypothetical protein
MDTFKLNQKIRITNQEHPLAGLTGIVVRPRISDPAAWVRIDQDFPLEHHPFINPTDPRHQHILLDPQDCEPNTMEN